VSVLTDVVHSACEATAGDIVAAEALALRVHALAGGGVVLLTAPLLGLLVPVQSVVA
jgi:hypothetical protein